MIIDGEDDEDDEGDTPPRQPNTPPRQPEPSTSGAAAAALAATASAAAAPAATASAAASPAAAARAATGSKLTVDGGKAEAEAETAARTAGERGGAVDAMPRCPEHALPGETCPLCPAKRDERGGGCGQSVPSMAASELAFATAPVTGALGASVAAAVTATEPSRAQRRLHELQQQASQSLLRAMQTQASSAREQLEATCRAATSATSAARHGAAHMEDAASQLRSLTVELRAMRDGTCLESLPPPKFNI